MPSPKKKLSKSTIIQLIVVGVILLALVGYVIWDINNAGPLTRLFSDRDRLIEIVNNLGIFGPIAYIGLQILQTIVAPIPGNLVGTIGGFLFGWWGILWTTIGATIGATVVFYLSRRFGRTLVEKLVKKETLDKVDFIIGKRAGLVLFLIFLIPGLPDDVVCYVAGLTDVPLKRLVAIFAIGRLPAVIVNNYIGMGLNGEADIRLVGVISVIAVIIFVILYKQQERILRLLGRQNQLETDNQALRHDVADLSDDGKLNNSIAKKSKKH